MIGVPFSAWAGEIDRDYHGRTRVVTYQLTLRSIGLLLVLVLPTLLDQIRPGDGELKLQVVGGFILVTLLPALVASALAFREAPLPAVPPTKAGLWATVRVVFSDGLLLRVLASDVAVTAGQSIRAGLIVFFAVNYMGLPAWASGLYLLQFIFGVLAGPIWLRIGYRLGKRETAITGELAQAAINIGLIFVFPGMLGLMIALTVAQGLTQGSGNLMLRAMVGDVADAHRVKTGHDRTGLFYSVFSLSAKLGPAIGVGIALPLVAWFGFAPKSASAPGALEALKYVFALGPALAHILAAALIWRFPLDQAAYAEVRRALDAQTEPTA
jgi:Na+/melibiose symporter-like transporter